MYYLNGILKLLMCNGYHLSHTMLLNIKDSTRGLIDNDIALGDMFDKRKYQKKKSFDSAYKLASKYHLYRGSLLCNFELKIKQPLFIF